MLLSLGQPFLDYMIEFQVADEDFSDDDELGFMNVRNSFIDEPERGIRVPLREVSIDNNFVIGFDNGPVMLWSNLCHFPNLIYTN